MRIEYWGHIREKSGSYYVTIESAHIRAFAKSKGYAHPIMLKGEEVKVEVTL